MARRRLEEAVLAGQLMNSEVGKIRDVSFRQLGKQVGYCYADDKEGVYCIQFSFDGSLVAVGHGNGSIQTVDTATGEPLLELRFGRQTLPAITSLRFNPQNQTEVWATTSCGNIVAANTRDGTSSTMISEPGNEINCLDFNMDGQLFATGGSDRIVRVYDTATAKEVVTFSGSKSLQDIKDESSPGHNRRIFALKFHPDDLDVFLTGGWDDSLHIWDVRTPTGLMRIVPGPHICADALDIKGSKVLTASWVNSDALQLWDYGSGHLIQIIPFRTTSFRSSSADGALTNRSQSKDWVGPGVPSGSAMSGTGSGGEYLYCAQFCTSDVVAAGGTGTNSVQVVNIVTGMMLNEIKFDRPVYCLDNALSGQQLAVGGASNKALLTKFS